MRNRPVILGVLLVLVFSLFSFSNLSGQSFYIKGKIVDIDSGEPIEDVIISLIGNENEYKSDNMGAFSIPVSLKGEQALNFSHPDFLFYTSSIYATGTRDAILGTVKLTGSKAVLGVDEEDVITTSISQADLDDESEQNYSSVLSASRDIFVSTAAFTFGQARFRIRGYDTEYVPIYMNGVPVNDLENGRFTWSTNGGLNDVFRNWTFDNGLASIAYGYGGVGGASSADLRASRQRKQLRVSYARSNRSWENRVMATYSTGMQANGWAFSFSGSRRWAQEGYVAGTFYDAWGYFASVEKKFNNKHSLNLVAFGAPNKRGRSAASVQEMYDLSGDNYYNPYWGYQVGKKRNSRVGTFHQPMAILRHDWNPNEKLNIVTAVSYQAGRNGSTALEWYEASDPRPDYYRRLPSFVEDPEVAETLRTTLMENEEARQVNWHRFYEINRNSFETIEDVGGVAGNNVSGNRSKYIVEERRYDAKKLNVATTFTSYLNDSYTLIGGLTYQRFNGDNYKLVTDLLGGDYYVDIDKFAERDFAGDSDIIQSDLDNPNRVVREGDRFGYSFQSTIHKPAVWANLEINKPKWDAFISATASSTRFWRTGEYRNGKFPENSQGDSEVAAFFNYGGKVGFTYKINGRNYLYAKGAYETKAPYFRYAFLSPRTRNEVLPNLTDEKILSGEAGYLLRSPIAKARLGVYHTTFKDQIFSRSFFHDEEASFVNFTMSGIDKKHMGTEAAIEVNVTSALSVNAVASIGTYVYENRPSATISQDNNAEVLISNRTVYAENFFVAGRPQTAATLGFRYRSKNYWSLSMNVNYFDHSYVDFNPDRRTAAAVENVDKDTPLWDQVIEQEKFPKAITADLFASKSFRFKRKYYMYLTLGINNLFNNKEFITGGFEQLRFDYEGGDVDRFPSKYYYSYGTNFFFNIAFRI